MTDNYHLHGCDAMYPGRYLPTQSNQLKCKLWYWSPTSILQEIFASFCQLYLSSFYEYGETGSLGTAATYGPIVPADDAALVDLYLAGQTEVFRGKHASVPLCPSQVPGWPWVGLGLWEPILIEYQNMKWDLHT